MVLFHWGCGRDPQAAEAVSSAFSVRIAHLHDYAWRDQNRNGQPDNLKPEAEREALKRSILEKKADVLVLRGLGSESALYHFQASLEAAGFELPHAHYIPGPTVYAGIGFLSAREPADTRSLSELRYTVRGRSHQPLAGGIRVVNDDGRSLWIWNAEFSEPSVDYERRRNEARLLAQSLRDLVQEDQDILLSLHSREDPDSPMLRMIRESGLRRLTPVDDRGDSWTHRDPDGFTYRMDQWVFVTEALHTQIENAEVIDSPDIQKAGPFRHQHLTLQAGHTGKSSRTQPDIQ